MSIGKYVVALMFLSAEIFNFVNGDCTLPGSPFASYAKSGTIQSNGYPDRYYGNEECDWSIHPPVGTYPKLLILRLMKLDTNIDNIPESHKACHMAENYLNIEIAKACGVETSICVSFIIQSGSSTLDCHRKLSRDYPECIKNSASQRQWPVKLSFRTASPDNRAGFKLNYTYEDCSAFPFPMQPGNLGTEMPTTGDTSFDGTMSDITTETPENSTSTTKLISQYPISITIPTTQSSSTTRLTTQSSSTRSTARPFTLKAESTLTSANVQSTSITTTAKTINKGGVSSTALTAVLVTLCVMLFFVILIIVFRKRIYVWIKKEKKPVHMNGSAEKGGATQYTDAYLVPIGENHTNERPLPGAPPPIPPAYRTSVNSDTNLMNEEPDSLPYDKLNGHPNGIVTTLDEESTYTSITT